MVPSLNKKYLGVKVIFTEGVEVDGDLYWYLWQINTAELYLDNNVYDR